MGEIWDKWLPGVLCKQQIRELCTSGFIANTNLKGMDDPTIDLHLTDDAYELVRGAVKPFGSGFLKGILNEGLAKKLTPNGKGEFHLEVRNTYLFRLREKVVGDGNGALWGQATAKSSVGRLDVLARLVVDGMRHYEGIDGDELKKLGDRTHPMYLEVTPFTFPVVVRAGISLNQLRLFYGRPSHCEIRGKEVARTCLGGSGTDHNLGVDPVSWTLHPYR